MLKMRMMFGLIAVVMVLALAQSGYSQLVINATSNPNPTADVVGLTEPTFNPNQGFRPRHYWYGIVGCAVHGWPAANHISFRYYECLHCCEQHVLDRLQSVDCQWSWRKRSWH